MDPTVDFIDVIQRKLDYCAKDSGVQTADLKQLICFKTEKENSVIEAAKLLTINFVHVLKSPVIVTRSFVDSVVSFIVSQPKHPLVQNNGASSPFPTSPPFPASPPPSSPPSSPSSSPIDSNHIVECMSTMDTIRALCLPGLFCNIRLATDIANQIIRALNGEIILNIETVNSFYDISKVFPALPYSSGAIREKEPGAWLYDSSIGPIQVGIPPETIKTSMKNKESVPKIYVLPHILCASGGVSYGEVEFPIYFNFFIKKAMSNPESRVVMIGHQAQLKRVQTIFKESMFGPNPDEIFISEEITQEKKDTGYAIDFMAERSILAFKGPSGKEVTIDDFATFVAFDEYGVATTKGTRQRKRKFSGEEDETVDSPTTEIKIVNSGGLIKFYEDGVLRGTVDSSLPPPVKHVNVFPSLPAPFIAPTLGVTFLGTSHGFDPNGSTTGFIVWVNGHGILIDPPPHTGQYLTQHGISPLRVNTVILTHCHSDHDSGILQRILEGGKIDLYTTRTINESYKRKARATTGRSDIESYYNWIGVQVGAVMKIHGASFEFDYSLHTIPTIRFRMRFQGKSISYSADTKYDPLCYAQLLNKGTINVMREISLRMFVFDADLIIHESGVPPIHTDAAELDALPPSIKSKLYVVHTHNIPETVMRNGKQCKVQGLRIPKEGLENSISLDVGEFSEGFSTALRRFRLFCEGFIFRKLAPETLYKLVCASEEKFVPAGTEIISQGDHSDRIFVLESGQVQVSISGNCQDILTVGAIFGENALVQSEQINRSASVIALTDVQLLVLDNTTYFKVAERDELSIEKDIGKIAKHVAFLQTALTKAFPEMGLTKQQLEAFSAAIDKQTVYPKDSIIIREGDIDNSMFIVQEGSIRLERFSKEIRRLMPGDCFGEISMLTGLPRTATAIANEDSVLLELKRDAFQDLMERYQHIRFHVVQMMEQRLVEGKRLNYIINK